MKKRSYIILAVATITILAIAMCLLFVDNSDRKYNYNLDLGQKYLRELNYDQAIAYFKIAIEIDPMKDEAYIGIADAYVAVGDYKSAISELELGYASTHSDKIKVLLDRISAEYESLNVYAVANYDIYENNKDILENASTADKLFELYSCIEIDGKKWYKFTSDDIEKYKNELASVAVLNDEKHGLPNNPDVYSASYDGDGFWVSYDAFFYDDSIDRSVYISCDECDSSFDLSSERDSYDISFMASYVTNTIEHSSCINLFSQYMTRHGFRSAEEVMEYIGVDVQLVKESGTTIFTSEMFGDVNVTYDEYEGDTTISDGFELECTIDDNSYFIWLGNYIDCYDEEGVSVTLSLSRNGQVSIQL